MLYILSVFNDFNFFFLLLSLMHFLGVILCYEGKWSMMALFLSPGHGGQLMASCMILIREIR